MKASGVFWAGHVFDRGGYGTVSRNYLKMLKLLKVPVHIYNIGPCHDELSNEDVRMLENIHRPISALGPNPLLIIHSLPDDFNRFDYLSFKRKIGVTIFETDRIPDHWINLCNQMNQIWVPSSFNYHTYTNAGVDKHIVKVVPYGIDVKFYNPCLYKPFKFPFQAKPFVFLYCAQMDYRKGFDLLIKSFCEEFNDCEEVSLFIKTYVHESIDIDAEAIIKSYIPKKENVPCIHVYNKKMPQKELLSLYTSSNCYISTDRACGWGMPQMEMMALGKPVISINWGGSTEFICDKNCFLIQPENELEPVDIQLMLTRPSLYLGHQWAKVKEEGVRKVMREAYENEKKRAQIAQIGKEQILNKYSIESVSRIIESII
ncbi:glycosyltransferase family 4 protein [Fictibacillus fluitans]|uniref:Glycosyltransferase family 4 protein n=1 Tax=Fictibacillus fluitans TaxID=3058422 RepID=A0ABT8HS77_9BACL|nr:glycosyltransferase family 4 protein [Fictibacillus sp. NE201]MDN4523627.1 glycosyltransferase family 4 protein [Fictibacillus sp. NE201]